VTSLFQQFDARARLLAITTAIFLVASTPPGVLRPFSAYIPLCLLLMSTARVSLSYLLWRALAASPFILLAAGLLAVQGGVTPSGYPAGIPAALSVAGKGYTAAFLLAFLTATTPLAELLMALRRLRAPHVLNVILAMMYRYTSLLSEEYARMERARECRTVRPLGFTIFSVYGRQLGALVLRSWDRAERVHASMLARGFNGVWPGVPERAFRAADWLFLTLLAALFFAARLLLAN
jgi:cobalt/nickel transport system permease protein